MLFLLLSILCSVAIANLLMLHQRRGEYNILPVFLGNYFVASLFSYAAIPKPVDAVPSFDLLFGALTGMLFLANFWVYQKSIVVNGLSLSVGAMRIAMIVPILLAVAAFGESLSLPNLMGIALGMAAFSLKANPKELHNLLWITVLFIVSGFTDASLKIYKELGSNAEPTFIYTIFTSAFVFTLLFILIAKIRLSWQSVLLGCLLGLPNRLSTVFFLKGLDSIPAAIAYPFVAVSIVLGSIISDLLLWKKRATWQDALLWALLLLALVLLNL